MSGREAGRQAAFYASGRHDHLQPGAADHYAAKLAARVAAAAGLEPHHRVIEVGAGFGRFTFALLEHCASVVALDLSARALEALVANRDARSIPEARCRTLECDVDDLDVEALGSDCDAVVGFFFLHHVPDCARTVARLARLLAPGGRMAFVEPNRRNPLFALQVAFCADMKLREEWGMFRLGRSKLEGAYRAAGLEEVGTETFGFFPPQVLERIPRARALEERLEAMRPLNGVLPFLLTTGRRRIGSSGDGGAR